MTVDLFGLDWYLRHNADVAAAVDAGLMDARAHFDMFGRHEGRAPGPGFDPNYYLARNADVAEAVAAGLMTAYDHFLNFGMAEGRSFLTHFDAAFYVQHNPDVGAAVEQGLMTAIEHFLLFGMAEQRALNPFFDMAAYLRANADLAAAVEQGGLDPLDHLMRFGLSEGRDLGNGISLAQFLNDPVFLAGIAEGGNTFDAMARVSAVAPFMRGFEAPAGWVPAADTPIPVDFVPLPGVKLVVPPSVIVPDGMILPDTFGPIPGPVPPEPEPPAPPVPPVPDDGPTTVWHLYDGNHITARPIDELFVIHIDIGKENFIEIDRYLESHVIVLSQIPGLQVYDDTNERQLDLRQARYDGDSWLFPATGDDVALWLSGKFHVQLTGAFGETTHLHVGENANSFGYETVRVNGAPMAGLGGWGGELLLGSDGAQVFLLTDADMAIGGADMDVFVRDLSTTVRPAIIGDYNFADELDLIVLQSVLTDYPVLDGPVSPFDLTVQVSENHLVATHGLAKVPDGGPRTDLEVMYGGDALLHIADIDDGGAGAASKSTAFLLDDGLFAVYNVWDGGEIDTSGAWPEDDDAACTCGVAEFLFGGEGSQTIIGGEVALAWLDGGAGDDTLESDAELAIYVGGSGNDAITIGEGTGWVRFEASASENGFDTISSFKVGDCDALPDFLDFTAFLFGTELDLMESWPDVGGPGLGRPDPSEAVILAGGGNDAGRVVVGDFGEAGPREAHFSLNDGQKAVGINSHDDTIWFVEGVEGTITASKVAELVGVSGEMSSYVFVW